jgi:drug/metabolite transporter (DMT)-like permease
MTAPPVPRPLGLLPHTRRCGIALAFVTATISGVAVFTNGYAVGRFGASAPFTTAKNLVAALLLGGLLALATRRRSEEGWTSPSTRGQAVGLVAVGVIGGSVPFLLFFEGLSRSSSSDAAFIHKTLFVWVALLAVTLLRERIGWIQLLALAVLVVGQAALTDDLGTIGAGDGEMMILAATLLWAVEVVIAKRLLADLSALTVGVARMGIGAMVLLGWLAATGQLGDLLSYDASQWAWVVATGLLLAGYVASWYLALARAPAVDVSAVLVFGAVITAALNGAFEGTPVRPDLVGLGLLVVGAATIVLAALRRPAGAQA